MEVARRFLAARYTHDDGALLLRHWRGGWWHWRTTHWVEIEDRAIRSAAYEFTGGAFCKQDDKVKPWAPNRNKIGNLLEALAAICFLPGDIDQPSWIDANVTAVTDVTDRDLCRSNSTGTIVAFANGLLDLGSRALLPHTPRFFNQTAVPFNYDPCSPLCTRWREFLESLWGVGPTKIAIGDIGDSGDIEEREQSIKALQEWFGYVISGRTDLHKILLMVGPTRGGKGATARVLGALVGRANVAGPTLSSLRDNFGIAPLIGKPLAVISDARLSGRESSVVVERLLSVSGEDWITVDRKYRDPWTGKLASRFMICSNELPQLGDASAAIAGRFVTLLLDRSWLGEEDPELEPALHRELPGILNWALEGLDRLEKQGRFTRPKSTADAFIALQDLASPVRAFVRDRCVLDADHEIPREELWKAWREWANDNGHGRGGTKQMFGRDLRAALPRLRRGRASPDDNGKRPLTYVGIALLSETDEREETSDTVDQRALL